MLFLLDSVAEKQAIFLSHISNAFRPLPTVTPHYYSSLLARFADVIL
jgi:hypothetical protein